MHELFSEGDMRMKFPEGVEENDRCQMGSRRI